MFLYLPQSYTTHESRNSEKNNTKKYSTAQLSAIPPPLCSQLNGNQLLLAVYIEKAHKKYCTVMTAAANKGANKIVWFGR